MSAASGTFDQALRSAVRDALQGQSFVFDKRRTFRKVIGGGAAVQIINFQLGQRSLQGKFAVNLGVYVPGDLAVNPPDLKPEDALEYHCAPGRRERLGRLIPRPLPALQHVPWLGALFGPKDLWWPFSEDTRLTETSIAAALDTLRQYGFRWLDAATPADLTTTTRPDEASSR